MPSSRPDVISEILYLVMGMKPKTILDVGIGYGKWGILCTEYLKYWSDVEPVIDGIEVFNDYRSPAWQVYSTIFHDDVMNLLDEVRKYDLVLAVDVVEHLDREGGELFLNSIKGHYIVSTPNYWMPQEASFGNEHEKHLSVWHSRDFENCMIINDKAGRSHILGYR